MLPSDVASSSGSEPPAPTGPGATRDTSSAASSGGPVRIVVRDGVSLEVLARVEPGRSAIEVRGEVLERYPERWRERGSRLVVELRQEGRFLWGELGDLVGPRGEVHVVTGNDVEFLRGTFLRAILSGLPERVHATPRERIEFYLSDERTASFAMLHAGGLSNVLTDATRASLNVAMDIARSRVQASSYPINEVAQEHRLRVTLASVRRCGRVYESLSPDLQANRDVALAALAQDILVITHLRSETFGGRELAAGAVAGVMGLPIAEARAWLQRNVGVLMKVANVEEPPDFIFERPPGETEVEVHDVAGDVIYTANPGMSAAHLKQSLIRRNFARHVEEVALVQGGEMLYEYRGDVVREGPFVTAIKQGVELAEEISDAAYRYDETPLSKKEQVAIKQVSQRPVWIRSASSAMRQSRAVVGLATLRVGDLLRHAGEDLRGDVDIAWAAAARQGNALRWARPPARQDRRVVLAAVQNDGMALRYATGRLRADREVALAALKSNPWALALVPEELLESATFRERATSAMHFLNADDLRAWLRRNPFMERELPQVARLAGAAPGVIHDAPGELPPPRRRRGSYT
jgi:hypothetical protein